MRGSRRRLGHRRGGDDVFVDRGEQLAHRVKRAAAAAHGAPVVSLTINDSADDVLALFEAAQ